MVSKPSRPPVSCWRMPLRLAEIDVAGQLAHDQDVQPRDHLGPQRRCVRQFRVDLRRAQVGEQAEFLAQAEDRLLGTLGRSSLSYFGSPTAPNRMASASLRQRQRRCRQRIARRPRSRAADRRLLELELQRRACPSTSQRLGNDFLADAVTRQHCDFHVGPTGTARETAPAGAPRRRGSCRRGAA